MESYFNLPLNPAQLRAAQMLEQVKIVYLRKVDQYVIIAALRRRKLDPAARHVAPIGGLPKLIQGPHFQINVK